MYIMYSAAPHAISPKQVLAIVEADKDEGLESLGSEYLQDIAKSAQNVILKFGMRCMAMSNSENLTLQPANESVTQKTYLGLTDDHA